MTGHYRLLIALTSASVIERRGGIKGEKLGEMEKVWNCRGLGTAVTLTHSVGLMVAC